MRKVFLIMTLLIISMPIFAQLSITDQLPKPNVSPIPVTEPFSRPTIFPMPKQGTQDITMMKSASSAYIYADATGHSIRKDFKYTKVDKCIAFGIPEMKRIVTDIFSGVQHLIAMIITSLHSI